MSDKKPETKPAEKPKDKHPEPQPTGSGLPASGVKSSAPTGTGGITDSFGNPIPEAKKP